jgi:hypothetical protein
LRDWGRARRTSAKIAGISTEFRTEPLPNTSLERYDAPADSAFTWYVLYVGDSYSYSPPVGNSESFIFQLFSVNVKGFILGTRRGLSIGRGRVCTTEPGQ